MTRLRGSRPIRRASLLRATPSRRTPLLACIAGALVAAGLLGLPAAAQAQSSVGLTATPSPFTSGTMIAIEASVTPGANPDSWCFESENCYIVGVLPFLHVYGSNGFYAYADDWSLDVNDPVPGQTMQGATYTAHGGVEWTVCWGFTYCVEYAYSDEEGWSSPATVTPAAPGPPTADWVSPSSGAGPGQIFTVQYSSEGGASYLAELWLVMHPSGGTTNSCVIGYYTAANTVVLWHDSGVGTPEESSGTPGSGTLLSNSQCAVSLSGTSVSTGVSTRTLTVPVAFAPGYHGVQYVYGWAKDGGGVYGSTAVLGNWLARARLDSVAPNPTTIGTTVTLTGDGFGASQGGSVAQVNATPLSVTSWTNTSITATVPPGATSGPVTVVTNGTWSNENLTLGIAGDPPGGADEVIYYHSDALGSVRMITDAAGDMVARYDYLPFGQPYPSDQDAEPRRFGQLERTAGTGNGSWTLLDYALARHYHSQSGRFTTPDDSIFGDPSDPQSMNLYAYARNNPLRFVDPSGHTYCPPGTETEVHVCAEAPLIDFDAELDNWLFNRPPPGSACQINCIDISTPSMDTIFWGVVEQATAGRFVRLLRFLTALRAVRGSFSLTSASWAKYPSWAPKPAGTLRVITGAEYEAARRAANTANAALRRANPEAYAGKQIHEILPVKFGGSPTDPANKIALTPGQHAELTNFWNQLLRNVR
jgi:RHS repeat-associated protein